MSDETLARVLETAAVAGDVRPQDDFFRHVNGRWLREHEIPADRGVDGAFHALRDLSEDRGREIAEAAAGGTLDDVDADLIAQIWTSFMDEDAVEAAGLSPLQPGFDAIDAAAQAGTLDSLCGRLMTEGVGTFFGMYISTDPHDSERRMVHFSQGGIGLPDEEYYREDSYADIRAAYVAHLERLTQMASLAPDAATASQTIMAAETRFASHHRNSVEERNPLLSDNQMTWAQLVEMAPGFDWKAWCDAAGLTLTDDTVVNVCQPDFLKEASAIWANTPASERALFLKVSLLSARASLLSGDFVAENFDFYGRTLTGAQQLRPRWKRALSLVESLVGESLGRVWVARHFPPESKERMDALVSELLRAYDDAIRNCAWMGEATKVKALEKLSTFRPKIGYPPKWRDMSGVDLSKASTLVDIVAAVRAFEARREFSRLNEPVDRDEWLMTPQTVNAYYNPPLNEIVFPAAILQPPFFDPEADDAVNFGAIGAVIGHEIGHGFDDQGSRFDAHGNLENWWTDEDRARFEELGAALIDQYNALTPENLQGENAPTVNGALTLGENIGDLAGLNIAWNAWENVLSDAGLTPETAPVIDGLNGPQRFFLAWARAWRTAARPEYARQMLSVDPHSPAEFRCNQILRNIDAFHATYATQEGDGMFLPPDERIRIW